MASVSAGMAAFIPAIAITAIFLLPYHGSHAQLLPQSKHIDSIRRLPADTLILKKGGTFSSLLPHFDQADSVLREKSKALIKQPNPLSRLKADSLHKISKAPLLSFKGGYVNYNFAYRSNIDTPYAEKDITQHILTGSLNFVVANYIPLRVNYWLRRSNSNLFHDITDVQLAFDPTGLKNTLVGNARRQWMNAAPGLNDSLLEKLYGLKAEALKGTLTWLQAPLTAQKLREYRELVQIPSLGYDPGLPDSTNRKRADSLQQQARQFIDAYNKTKGRYDSLKTVTDSLRDAVKKMRGRLQQYRQLAGAQPGDWLSYKKWTSELQQYQPSPPAVPDKYKWLMGIRSFSIGRTPVNTSELTAKNVSLTGIHIEYNTWYYISLTAGIVDYRFRDFVVNRFGSTPQYLYMARLGLGRLEKNYFIVSVSRGRKQLYASSGNGARSSITITGLAVETKWQVHRTTWFMAEAAQSLSPDYRQSPPENNGKFSFSDNLNKALSLQWHTYLPKTHSILEGMYKYTGANYQSFSSFQTNAAMKSWYVKWEQSFFNRQLRLTGALRSNEFTNPYIQQNYKSNSVFKSINAVFKRRRWPVVTIGYVPMSQLTVIDQQVVENRFQTITASLNHFYRLGTRQTSTTIVYNKFYNNSSDTGFIYFNALNLFYAQNFLFNHFSAGIAASRSASRQYQLNVMEGNVYINFKRFSPGVGVKVNSLNGQDTKAGAYVNANMRVSRKDIIYVSYEHGFLPGTGRKLVRNDMGSIQYSRSF